MISLVNQRRFIKIRFVFVFYSDGVNIQHGHAGIKRSATQPEVLHVDVTGDVWNLALRFSPKLDSSMNTEVRIYI